MAQGIVDSHSHIGMCDVFGLNQTPGQLLAEMDRHEIQVAVVQPFPGVQDARLVHDEIATMAAHFPGRVYGLASIWPHGDPDVYEKEIRRCIGELGFVGIKIHTLGHAVGPRSPGALRLITLAAELRVPIMIHTGTGIPFSDPGLWLPLIQRHPTTQFILAHAGAGILGGAALSVAQVCPNVTLETSFVPPQEIRGFCATLGVERVMYGSDVIPAISTEIAKYESLDLREEERNKVMSTNATTLFRLAAQP